MIDYGETVAIAPRHVQAIARTWADGQALTRPGPRAAELRDAAWRLADVLDGQEEDAVAWIVPAGPLGLLAHRADGLTVYGLEECESASYRHPGVRAEHAVAHAVAEQAPRTDAALSVILEAEVIVLLAESFGG